MRSPGTGSLPSEKPARRFQDIFENIERIERFTAAMDLAAFVAQEHVVYAVLYALLVISEAARKLGEQAAGQERASCRHSTRPGWGRPSVRWWNAPRTAISSMVGKIATSLALLTYTGVLKPKEE